MNDRELEARVREAFDAIEMPPEVGRSALARIEEVRKGLPVDAQGDSHTVKSVNHASRKQHRANVWRRVAVALAACFALAAIGFGGARLYADPTAYVGIDVNPSIELALNRFDIVVSAEAKNDDAVAVLDSVHVVGMSYADAVATLTASEAMAPYLQSDAYVEFSVTSDNDQQAGTLEQQSLTCLESLPCAGSCHYASEQERQQAHDAGMGVGRYRAATELMALDSTVTLDECASMTMRELCDRIDACSDRESEQSEDAAGGRNGAQDGSGSGHHFSGQTRHQSN